MGSPRKIKETKIELFQNTVNESKAIVLAEYKGLTVHELESLRGKLREVGSQLRVVKNTLAKVAFHNLGINELDPDLNGQIAFVFSKADAVTGTKVANQFSKEKEAFKLRSGWFQGKRLNLEEIKSLANLPSKKELQAAFVGLLAAPVNQFVLTLTAPLSEFIATLEARAAKIDTGSAPESEAAA
jgi:large subunit ribosomal protein L10